MSKRIISAVCCLVFLLGLALPVHAEPAADPQKEATELRIASVKDFLQFAENCRLDSYSQGLTVILEADLDLSGLSFSGIPIFSGNFEGKHHTISGLQITSDGSALGLFRYLTSDATVDDLTVVGEVRPGGSRSQIGGIAGCNAGLIRNCRFRGTVSGAAKVGGIAGTNAVTGIIENCRTEGELQGDHFAGGLAGENYGVIRDCINRIRVNATAQQNSVDLSDISLDTLVNSEAADTVTDIGGIAGFSSGVIRSCYNRGDVGYQHMGYNVGGIAGTQSGYLAECGNYAQVSGRKEVGGIVGQMEPVTVIEYSDDTLQILQQQLGTMAGLVNQAAGNTQNNTDQITNQMDALKGQAHSAQEALDTLIPDEENPELPDADTILAAHNTLQSSISAMPGTMNSIAAAAQDTATGLSRDLLAISMQLSAMNQTISEAGENLGGSVTDISDQDTADNLTGKAEGCINTGSVLADMNAGGIAGAMAMENDLDVLEDWQQIGENSMNFDSQVRAVVLNCINQGTVTGTKQHIGGIAGWQSLGLVKDCVNTGSVEGTEADCVGGISGLSTGYIRSSSAKCSLSGDSYVGGIAGSAGFAMDNRSMVKIRSGREKLGAILGSLGENTSQEEKPVCGNYYFAVAGDAGGIDGISYAGLAEPLELEAFLALAELPEAFRTVSVRFVFEDGSEKEYSLAPGSTLEPSKIPAIPQKEGFVGTWKGLTKSDLSNVSFDLVYTAEYNAFDSVIQSEQTGKNGLPLLLLQGDFTGESSVFVAASDSGPVPAGDETLAKVWRVELFAVRTATGARLLLPEDLDENGLKLLVCNAEGKWTEREYTVDGSYLVFSWGLEDTAVALMQTESRLWIWLLAGAGVLLAAGAAAGILVGKRKKKKAKPEAAQEE